jgi:glycosyltransferase involved in cell wall biosynthesis
MRKATYVACPSEATRNDLAAWSLVATERLVVVPNGVHRAFSPTADSDADAAVARLIGRSDTIDLLHVGSCIRRKRIDRLLAVVAAVRRVEPRVRLLKAGGRLTQDQRTLARRLGIMAHVVELPFLPPALLAALYRRAALLVISSDREGFGLPVAEALACGTTVVATDLPVFREVGGSAAHYCPPDLIDRWVEQVMFLLDAEAGKPDRERRRLVNVTQGSRYSWEAYARHMAQIYRDSVCLPAPPRHRQAAEDTGRHERAAS